MSFKRTLFNSTLNLLILISTCCLYTYSFGETIYPEREVIEKIFTPVSKEQTLNEINASRSEEEKILLLIRLSLRGSSTWDESSRIATEALERSKKINFTLGEGLSYFAFIRTAINAKEIDSLSAQAYASFNKLGDRQLIALTDLYTAFSLHQKTDDYVRIFSLINQFLAHYTIYTDRYSFAIAWNSLGEVYRTINNNIKAQACYLKALSYSYENGNLTYPSPLINLGTIHKNLGNYDSALYYYDRTLTLDTSRSASMHAYIKFRKAQVYTHLGEINVALRFGMESLETYHLIKSKIGLVLASSALTKIYDELGQEYKCIDMATQCLAWSSEINHYPEESREVCKILIKIYQKRKEFEKALHFQKLYAHISDNFFSPSITIKMQNEQLKLETRTRELENTLLMEKQQEKEKEIRTQKSIIIVSIVGLLLSIGLFIFTIKQNKTIALLNQKLKQTNEEMIKQSNDLKASNEEIEAINTNLEELVNTRAEKIIEQNKKLTEYAFYNAHKVRGPLARILGLIALMEIEISNDYMLQVIHSLKAAGGVMDNHIRELNVILESSDSISDT